jgi:hypothetical protein
VNWVEGTATLGEGHVHPPCAVYGLEVHRADLLALWSGPLKPPKPRRRSIRDLVKQAEKSGHPVGSVTLPDGMTIHFGQREPGEANNPWFDDLRRTEAKQ